MHPPFYVVGRNASPSPHHPKPHVRRSAPQWLDLSPADLHWPPVPLAIPKPQVQPLQVVTLRFVPAPKKTVRDVIGRWLIRAGQRMILP